MSREHALAYIATASDADLLRLAAMLRHWKTTEDNERKWLAQGTSEPHKSFEKANTPVTGVRETGNSSKTVDKDTSHPTTPRQNQKPPGAACQRIGSETKAKLLAAVPATLSDLAKVIGQRQESASALLKLLWDRNEIKFDGENYYA